MSHFFLDRDAAAAIEPLARLLDVGTWSIADYEAPFRRLLTSDALQQLVIDNLGRFAEIAPRFSATAGDNDWRLMVTDRFSLGVRMPPVVSGGKAQRTTDEIRPARKFLVALPNDVLYGVVGSGHVMVDLYRASAPRAREVFSRGHRLERAGTRRLECGDVLRLCAGEDVADFAASEPNAVLVELALIQADKIVWNYDVDTLQAAFASSASVEATRAEFAIDLFQIFEYTAAIPNLLVLAREHSHHWVRWKAVKTILHLDLEQGMAALRAALDDPHEHVRNAAQATLRNLIAANLAQPGVCHGA